MDIDFYRFPFKLQPHYRALSMSYNDLVRHYTQGAITDLQYRWAMLFCSWSAIRHEGKAGRAQDLCYSSLGAEGVDRRITRIGKIREAYRQHHFGAYTWEALGPR